MAKKSKIYTKKGDFGETSLVGGQRVEKSNLRVDLYGDIDELNAHIGMVASLFEKDRQLKEECSTLYSIQERLFDLGSLLACEWEERKRFKLPSLGASDLRTIEERIDHMDEHSGVLKSFILPGGDILAAQTHICRTVCRRVERKLIQFIREYGKEEAPSFSVSYLNRLSDYFFSLARYVNFKKGRREIYWGLCK